jgi:hypothetical protein
MKIKILFEIIFLSLLMVSCYTEEELPAPTNTEILTSDKWVYELLNVFPAALINGEVVNDVLSAYPDCGIDNEFKYFKDGTFIVTEGSSKCSFSDPDIVDEGTWRFSSDGKELIETFNDGASITKTISEIDGTKLYVSWNEIDRSGQMFRFNAHFYRFNRFR